MQLKLPKQTGFYTNFAQTKDRCLAREQKYTVLAKWFVRAVRKVNFLSPIRII